MENWRSKETEVVRKVHVSSQSFDTSICSIHFYVPFNFRVVIPTKPFLVSFSLNRYRKDTLLFLVRYSRNLFLLLYLKEDSQQKIIKCLFIVSSLVFPLVQLPTIFRLSPFSQFSFIHSVYVILPEPRLAILQSEITSIWHAVNNT